MQAHRSVINKEKVKIQTESTDKRYKSKTNQSIQRMKWKFWVHIYQLMYLQRYMHILIEFNIICIHMIPSKKKKIQINWHCKICECLCWNSNSRIKIGKQCVKSSYNTSRARTITLPSLKSLWTHITEELFLFMPGVNVRG